MSIYLNPVNEVEIQEQSTIIYPISFNNLKHANPNKIIVGVYYNGLFKVACVLIDEKSDFDWMENQYKQGLYLNRWFYNVTQEFVESHK